MVLAAPDQLGYPALAGIIFAECAGLPVPGETALIVAGGLAAAGKLSLPIVVLVAAVAATVGDTMGYWIGRRGGRALLLRDGRGARHRRAALARADRFVARYGVGAVFLARWIAGARYAGALLAGASRMPWPRFAVANVLGALAWAAGVATVARAAGAEGSLLLAGAALAAGAAGVAFASVRRRLSRRPVSPGGGTAPARTASRAAPAAGPRAT
jgi:membrane protein DedA with SNARE-associated domain